MPFGKRAVPYCIKQAQYKPGTCSEQQGNKIKSPGSFPYPADKIKDDKGSMEYCKKPVENVINQVHSIKIQKLHFK